MDAGAQMRHGDLFPRWAVSPAFNAGEPRFLFYPPLSWLLGSLLLLLLPAAVVPAVFTFFCLTGAAGGMYLLCRRFAGRAAALLGTAVYVANPYVLFTAFERTAYAELLAAAWMPLLFRAALRETVQPLAVAVPLALLWLTNAPAAVMGTYALVLLVLLRLVLARVGLERAEIEERDGSQGRFQMAAAAAGGLALGLGLAGFYLLPAAWERRYVQIAMAIIPNMRVEDNFLFGHSGYRPHDAVLHTASLVAVETIGLLALVLAAASVLQARTKVESRDSAERRTRGSVLLLLFSFSVVVVSLLWHFALPVWHVLPELAFLQFPWRLLSVLGCVLGLAAALCVRRLAIRLAWAFVLALGIAGFATTVAIRPLRQGCEAEELPAARVIRFAAHHGVGPTDEYTPVDADNDQLRWDDPGWWLATTLNAPGPGTVPNPAATIEDYDVPPPLRETVAGFAPRHLSLHLEKPEELVLNLRDYPAWQVMVNGNAHPERLGRDDGLLALALPAGNDTVDIRWRSLPDEWAGGVLSALSVAVAGWLGWMARRSSLPFPSRRIRN